MPWAQKKTDALAVVRSSVFLLRVLLIQRLSVRVLHEIHIIHNDADVFIRIALISLVGHVLAEYLGITAWQFVGKVEYQDSSFHSYALWHSYPLRPTL